MGFGPDEDHLVVITDGRDRIHLTAFWRDELPAGATSRIAGSIPVSCGQPDDVAWIQSEQSAATLDRGALVVDNITIEGQSDRLIDVLVPGPLATAGNGAYALVQVLEDGDMLFTSVTGPVRVPPYSLDPRPVDPRACGRPASAAAHRIRLESCAAPRRGRIDLRPDDGVIIGDRSPVVRICRSDRQPSVRCPDTEREERSCTLRWFGGRSSPLQC